MGKKVSQRNYIDDSVTLSPENSIQKKPADLRDNPSRNYIDDFADPVFADEDDLKAYRKAKEKKELQKEVVDRQTSEDPYFTSVKTSEKNAKARIELIDEELKMTQANKRNTEGLINRKNTISKIFGISEDDKHLKQIEEELTRLHTERNEILSTDVEGIAEVEAEIAVWEKEYAEVSKNLTDREEDFKEIIHEPGSITPPSLTQELADLKKKKQGISDNISFLGGMRKELEYAATPTKGQDAQKIFNSVGQDGGMKSGNIDNWDILKEYDQDKVNKVLRTTNEFAYTDLADQHVEEQIRRKDYDNMYTGEYALHQIRNKMPYEAPEGISKLYEEVSKSKEYKSVDRVGKQKLMAKSVNDYFILQQKTLAEKAVGSTTDAPGIAKDALDKKKKAAVDYLSQRMLKNDTEDGFSLVGVQMIANHINGDLEDRRIEIETQRKATWGVNRKNPEYSSADRAAYDAKHGEKNTGLYLEQLDQEFKLLTDAIDFNKKILDMNPHESRIRQYTTGLTSMPVQDLLTAGISEMTRTMRIADLARKGDQGELNWTESKIMETYALLNIANGSEELDTGVFGISPYRVGVGTSAMIPYMLTFIGTNPAYAIGKAGGKIAVNLASKTVKPALSREMIRAGKILLNPRVAKAYGSKVFSTVDFAGRMVARTTGAATQAMASQNILQTAIAKETMPNVQMTFEPQYNGLYTKIEGKSPEELKEGKKKAYKETFNEIFFERTGAYIMKGLGASKAALSSTELVKRQMLGKYLGLKKLNNPNKSISNLVRKGLGWDGIAEEYFEELSTYFANNIANKEKAIQDDFFKEQLETLLTVTIFGSAMKMVNVGENWEVLRHGDQVKYTFEGENGKRKSVRLPRDINKELKDILDTKGSYDSNIMNFLYENRERLNKKQVNLVLNLLANKKHEDKINKIVKDAQSKQFPELATAGDDLAKEKKQSLADEIIEKSGVEDIAAEDTEAAPGTLAFEGTAESDLSEREFKTDEEKYNQPPPDITPDRFNDWVADESNNPSEIHLAWKEESANTAAEQSEGNPLEDYILGQKITEETWNEFADKSHQSAEIKTGWFRGKGRKLDDLRDEAASMKGISEDVTIQDIINVMLKHPKGKVRVTSDIQKRLAARYKQVTGKTINSHRVLNEKKAETIPAGEELFGEEVVTEGSTREDGQLDVSEDESIDIKKHNEQMVAEYPDLHKAGLLTQMPGGQLELPTYEELLDHSEQITREIRELTRSSKKSEVDIRTEEVISLMEKLGLLNAELNKKKAEDIPFEFLMPSAQNLKLAEELESGKKLKGKLTRKGNRIFQLQLEDGRVVKVIDPFRTKSAEEAVDIAVLNQEDVTLKEKDDKIYVSYDGTAIGIVEGTDREYVEGLKAKQNELGTYVEDQLRLAQGMLRKARGNMLSVLPLTSDHAGAIKHLAKAIKYLIKKGFNDLQILIEELKRQVRKSDKIETQDKPFWIDLIDQNFKLAEDLLRESFNQVSKEEATQLPLLFEGAEAQGQSSEKKKNDNLKVYNEIWRFVSKESKTSLADVERQFYWMARDPAFQDVSNDATYQHFLETNMNESPLMKSLIGFLSKRTFNEMVSAFDFYGGLRLTRQVGVFVQEIGKKGEERTVVNIKTLNPSDNYQDFINKFYTAVKNYVFRYPTTTNTYKGYEGIRQELLYHASQAKDLQNQIGEMSKEERIAARKEQHQKDLNLLAKITGQTPELWSKFFEEKKGNVREAQTVRQDKNSIEEFETYEALLEADTFKGQYWRVQSNIMGNLQYMVGKVSAEKFAENLSSYFLRGKGRNLSNLYQLLTANQDQDDLGLSGRDMKSDRFNSFIQLSHGYSTAENTDSEIIILNGLHNLKDGNAKGTHSAKMSTTDIWFSLAKLYAERGDTYYQHMGQFGDKASIYLIKRDKIKPTAEDYAELKKAFPDFEEAVEEFYTDVIASRTEMFEGLGEGETLKEQRYNFAMEFLYNYAVAMPEINQEFHGNVEQYADPKKGISGIIGMFKRGGSTISPGYLLNPNIEGGVGKSYRTLVVNDDVLKFKLSDGTVVDMRPDGLSVGTDAFFGKIAISMGDIYNKINRVDKNGKPIISEGYLTSIKAVHSNVKDGYRGLMKTNNINIRALEMKHKSIYEDLKKYMEKYDIDMITFVSGNKHTEEKDYEPIELFDANQKFKAKAPNKKQILTRSTSDLYVQQDLRHTTTPQSRAMASQQLANMISLPEGQRITEILHKIQILSLLELNDALVAQGTDNLRLSWVKKSVTAFSHPEIKRMLDAGVGINEPSMRILLRTMMASQVEKNVLDIPMNKVSQQEIPDIDRILRVRTEFTDKDGVKRILLPDIAANIDGVRAEWTNGGKFIGRADLAIAHVMARKSEYKDLLDRDGKLMEWEITGRNGAIPGEPIVSTRVPADDLHSHTVARLKFNLPAGNFTMLDWKSRLASGADFDGDARYNQVFFKDKNGNIILNDNSKQGLSNQLLMEMVHGYSDPAMTDRINSNVNPDAYNPIVDKRRAESKKKFSEMYEGDYRLYMKAWEWNKVGVDMKGMLTDMITLFSLASKHQIQLKGEIKNPVTGEALTAFVADEYGQMKKHLANLLNMAFDNAKDPKIEDMGLNEATVHMFMLGLMTDPKLNSGHFKTAEEHSQAIYNAIDELSKYFTSPVLIDFTKLIRRKNGGLEKITSKRFWQILGEEHKGAELELKKFFHIAQQLPEIRNFFRLAQDAPKSSTELIASFKLLDKIRKNKFDLFDSSNFFNHNTNQLRDEYAIIPEMLSFMWDRVFYDSIENTESGQDIIAFLIAKINEKAKSKSKNKKKFKPIELLKSQYDVISGLMHNILSVMSVNKKASFYEIRRDAVRAFQELEFTDNKFIHQLQIIPKPEGPTLQVAPEFTRANIDEIDLAEIHEDFNKLPVKVQDIFVKYVFHRFGSSPLRTGGSYYSLISDEKKIEIAEKNQEEIDNWDNGHLTPTQQYNIAKFIIYAAKDPLLNKLWGENQYSAMYSDVNVADPTTGLPLDYDALESTEGIIDQQSIKNWYEEYGLPDLSLKEFGDLLAETLNVDRYDVSFGDHLIPWAQKVLEARDKNINYFKNTNEQISDEELKDMVAQDVIGEALASDDPAIQEFILARMEAMYPEVEFFKSKDKFFNFLRKNGARLYNISPSAIGHALGNAVYADPKKAVQSTILHEYAHVYWDALPEDHYTKTQLVRHFRSLPGNENLPKDHIEEQIILAIGRSAFNMAEAGYNKSFSEKFAQLLQDFWAAVKRIFGKIDPTQTLVDEMAQALWENKDKINPQTVTGRVAIHNMAEPEMQSFLDEFSNRYIIGSKSYERVSMVSEYAKKTPFNKDERIAKMISDAATVYFETNGQVMPETDKIAMQVEIDLEWKRTNELGKMIIAIAEETFGGTLVTNEEVKDNFHTQEAYQDLKRSLNSLRKAFLEKYPNAEFETGHITYSNSLQIAGRISLRIKVGDNQYVIVNFKTTDFEYVNKVGERHSNYTRSWGSLKPDLPEKYSDNKETDHLIQTGLYAAMEEGKGREIVDVLIVPIMRFIKDGKIEGAWVAKQREKVLQNVIDVGWKDNDKGTKREKKAFLLQLANSFIRNKKKIISEPISDKDALIKAGINAELVDTQMNAETFISGFYELRNIQSKDVEALLGYGLTKLLDKLKRLGYAESDLYGATAIPMKYLFFMAYEDVSKEQWETAKDVARLKDPENPTMDNEFLESIEIGVRFVGEKNTGNTGETKYHLQTGTRDLYMEEAGHETLQEGDEIAQIATTIDRQTGELLHTVYYYTVHKVNKKNKIVYALDELDGQVKPLNSIDPNFGIMKIIDQDDAITKDSYQPKYWKERRKISNLQWKRVPESSFTGPNKEADYKEYQKQMHKVDRFFDDNSTIEELRSALNNKDKISNFYGGFRTVSGSQLDHFAAFMQESITANYLAEQIRSEAFFMKKNELKPAILSIYLHFKLGENDDDIRKSMFNFEKPLLTKTFLPDRLVDARNVPLQLVRRGVIEAFQDAMYEQIKLREILKPYLASIDIEKVTTKNLEEERIYKDPNDPTLSKKEREYVTLIYEYRYKYDPKYKFLKRRSLNTYPKKVKMSVMFATKGELRDKFAKKDGGQMRRTLMPSSYDDIPIDEVMIADDGQYIKTGKKTTLGEQKLNFAYVKGNDNHNRQWLGNRWKHFISKVVGQDRMSAGLLNHYKRKAIKVYEASKHSDPVLKRKKSMIPLSGRGNPKYQSTYFSEAEAKSIESLIFEHFLGPVLGPMDHIMAQAKGETDVTKWVEIYVNKVVLRQPADDMPEGFREFVDFLVRMNSLAKIAWQIRVQVKNLGIGVGMNITRETIPYLIGVTRTAASLFSPFHENQIAKVLNIMKRRNLVMHMADDPAFDKLEKILVSRNKMTGKAKHRYPLWYAIIDKGYKPMTIFENIIQIPLLLGLMTKEEFASYDRQGNVVDERNQISPARMHELREALRSVHGDYGVLNAAQVWQTTIGQAAFQFRKWGTAMFDKMFAEYQLDSNYKVHAGIASSFNLLFKMVSWNGASKGKKEKALEIMIMKKASKNEFDQMFFRGAREYLESLVIAANGNKITYKQIPQRERRRLVALMVNLAYGMRILLQLVLHGDDDEFFKDMTEKERAKLEKKGPKRFVRYMRRKSHAAHAYDKFMNRYSQDIYFMFSTEQYSYVSENPLPLTGILTNMLSFTVEFSGWLLGFFKDSDLKLIGEDKDQREFKIQSNQQVYEKDSRYSRAGWPKWISSALGMSPVGSQIRSMMENTFYVIDALPSYDIQKIFEEANVPQPTIDKIIERSGRPTLSKLEIQKWSEWIARFEKEVAKGEEALGVKKKLEELGLPPTPGNVARLLRTEDHMDGTTRMRKKLIRALEGLSLHQQYIMNQLPPKTMEAVRNAIGAAEEQSKEKVNMTEGQKDKEAENTLDWLQESLK